MERLTLRFATSTRTLSHLEENLKILQDNSNPLVKDYYEQFRSSAIQNFKFSSDTFWKFIKEYLENKYAISFDAPSSRAVFREAANVKLITTSELKMLNNLVADRNLTSHTYNENLAEEISKRLPEYYKVMHNILERIKL